VRDQLKSEIIHSVNDIIDNDKHLSPLTNFFHGLAVSEWISGISRLTATCRYMIDDFTNRINTACSWTRVLTSVSYASSIGCTIRIDYAFRSTTFVRISVEIGQASAGSWARNFATHSICATRWRLAWI